VLAHCNGDRIQDVPGSNPGQKPAIPEWVRAFSRCLQTRISGLPSFLQVSLSLLTTISHLIRHYINTPVERVTSSQSTSVMCSEITVEFMLKL
jgi:hypothetical protein